MATRLSVLLCSAVALTWLCYRLLIVPLLLSPLARLPRPHLACALTRRWFKRQVARKGELKTLYAAHQRHGPIVCLAPDQISVVSLEGIKDVYTAGLDKDVWYKNTFYVYGVQNLVCTLDHKTHSQFKKMVAGVYTRSFLQHSHDLDAISQRIIFARLLPFLRTHAQDGQPVDVMRMFENTAVDFISGYIFGTAVSTDFLQDEVGSELYFGEWARVRDSMGSQGKPHTENLFMDMANAALFPAGGPHSAAADGTSPVVLTKMYEDMSSQAKAGSLPEKDVMRRCASEVVDMILATQEANTITWTYILYRLSQHPNLQNELRKELQSLRPFITSAEESQRLPSPADIDRLPLLDAVVRETLRLHAANPARMPRVAPAGGLHLHGYFIPAGTTISTNAYCLHRNTEAFPNPLEWLPQRWQSSHTDKDTLSTMQRWFWAFGSGPRMCIGQNFALQVIKLVIAAIYSHYSTAILDDEGIEQSDSYNSAPISHKLILRFDAVDDG